MTAAAALALLVRRTDARPGADAGAVRQAVRDLVLAVPELGSDGLAALLASGRRMPGSGDAPAPHEAVAP